MYIAKLIFLSVLALFAANAHAFSLVEVNERGVSVQIVFASESDAKAMAEVVSGTKASVTDMCLNKQAVICEGVEKAALREKIYSLAKSKKVRISGMRIKVPKDSNPKFYK